MRDPKTTALRVAVHAGSLVPLVWLLWDLSQGHLTANPVREIQLRTGRYALTLLVLSLACTPAYRLLGLRQLLDLRRPLGLYAFLYGSLHFLNFLAIDYRFNLAFIRDDLFEKRYAVVGFAAYLILLALAITSTQGWQKRLGRTWKPLHRLVYAAAILGVVHLLWSVKFTNSLPLVYGAILALLLALRLPWLRQANTRYLLAAKKRPPASSI